MDQRNKDLTVSVRFILFFFSEQYSFCKLRTSSFDESFFLGSAFIFSTESCPPAAVVDPLVLMVVEVMQVLLVVEVLQMLHE